MLGMEISTIENSWESIDRVKTCRGCDWSKHNQVSQESRKSQQVLVSLNTFLLVSVQNQ